MKVNKTIFNRNLQKPDSITIECGNDKATFNFPSENKRANDFIKKNLGKM